MFITLEGIEGSGKTTLIENLADVFRTLNHEVLVTREPGGCALGRELRQMLLNPETEICPEAELFSSSRTGRSTSRRSYARR